MAAVIAAGVPGDGASLYPCPAPKAIRSDMSGPTLLGLVGAELLGGNGKKQVLTPSGNVTLPDGGAGLTVTDATKRAAVEKFLAG